MTFPGCGKTPCGLCPFVARAVVEDGSVIRIEWSDDGGATWTEDYGYYDCDLWACPSWWSGDANDPTVIELPGGATIGAANATDTLEGECTGTLYAAVIDGGSGYSGTFIIEDIFENPDQPHECPCEGTGPGTCCDHCSNPRCYAQDCENIADYPPRLQMRVKMNMNLLRSDEHYDGNSEFFDDEDLPPNLEFVCALPCGEVGQHPSQNGRCVDLFSFVIFRDPQTDASDDGCPSDSAADEYINFTCVFGTHQAFGDFIPLNNKCIGECEIDPYSHLDDNGNYRRCWFWMEPYFSYRSRVGPCVEVECNNSTITRFNSDFRSVRFSYAQCMTRATNGCPLACKIPIVHIVETNYILDEACYDDCSEGCVEAGLHPLPNTDDPCDYYCKTSVADAVQDSAYGIWFEPYEAGTTCCDEEGWVVESFAETVTSLSFSPASLAANAPAGTSAGTLSANVEATWRLACGPGDDDNSSFRIAGNEVRSAVSLAAGTYSIRVRAKASNRATREESFEVTVS